MVGAMFFPAYGCLYRTPLSQTLYSLELSYLIFETRELNLLTKAFSKDSEVTSFSMKKSATWSPRGFSHLLLGLCGSRLINFYFFDQSLKYAELFCFTTCLSSIFSSSDSSGDNSIQVSVNSIRTRYGKNLEGLERSAARYFFASLLRSEKLMRFRTKKLSIFLYGRESIEFISSLHPDPI